jgi:hypothetical protein
MIHVDEFRCTEYHMHDHKLVKLDLTVIPPAVSPDEDPTVGILVPLSCFSCIES